MRKPYSIPNCGPLLALVLGGAAIVLTALCVWVVLAGERKPAGLSRVDDPRALGKTPPLGKAPRTLGPPLVELTDLIGRRDHAGPMTFSPDARIFALPTHDGRIELWNLRTGRKGTLTSTVTANKWVGPLLAFSPDGHRLAVSFNNVGVIISTVSEG